MINKQIFSKLTKEQVLAFRTCRGVSEWERDHRKSSASDLSATTRTIRVNRWGSRQTLRSSMNYTVWRRNVSLMGLPTGAELYSRIKWEDPERESAESMNVRRVSPLPHFPLWVLISDWFGEVSVRISLLPWRVTWGGSRDRSLSNHLLRRREDG